MYSAAQLILLLRIFAATTVRVAQTAVMCGGKTNIHYFSKDKGSKLPLFFFIRRKYERKDYYKACD